MEAVLPRDRHGALSRPGTCATEPLCQPQFRSINANTALYLASSWTTSGKVGWDCRRRSSVACSSCRAFASWAAAAPAASLAILRYEGDEEPLLHERRTSSTLKTSPMTFILALLRAVAWMQCNCD